MKFLKFLHAVNQCLYALFRHCIVARCTEATHRAVPFDAGHSFIRSELQEIGFQIAYSGAITKQIFMRERSSLAAVPTNILLRSISAYSMSAFSVARRSISLTPP